MSVHAAQVGLHLTEHKTLLNKSDRCPEVPSVINPRVCLVRRLRIFGFVITDFFTRSPSRQQLPQITNAVQKTCSLHDLILLSSPLIRLPNFSFPVQTPALQGHKSAPIPSRMNIDHGRAAWTRTDRADGLFATSTPCPNQVACLLIRMHRLSCFLLGPCSDRVRSIL